MTISREHHRWRSRHATCTPHTKPPLEQLLPLNQVRYTKGMEGVGEGRQKAGCPPLIVLLTPAQPHCLTPDHVPATPLYKPSTVRLTRDSHCRVRVESHARCAINNWPFVFLHECLWLGWLGLWAAVLGCIWVFLTGASGSMRQCPYNVHAQNKSKERC